MCQRVRSADAERTLNHCSICQEFHDRYICAYPDRAGKIGREWDAHRREMHPRIEARVTAEQETEDV